LLLPARCPSMMVYPPGQPTKDQIEKIRKEIEKKMSLPAAAPKRVEKNENLLEIDNDMKILIAARERCRRKNCG